MTILISLIILFPNLKEKISDQKYDYITKPFLPLNKEEVPVKEYHKTKDIDLPHVKAVPILGYVKHFDDVQPIVERMIHLN